MQPAQNIEIPLPVLKVAKTVRSTSSNADLSEEVAVRALAAQTAEIMALITTLTPPEFDNQNPYAKHRFRVGTAYVPAGFYAGLTGTKCFPKESIDERTWWCSAETYDPNARIPANSNPSERGIIARIRDFLDEQLKADGIYLSEGFNTLSELTVKFPGMSKSSRRENNKSALAQVLKELESVNDWTPVNHRLAIAEQANRASQSPTTQLTLDMIDKILAPVTIAPTMVSDGLAEHVANSVEALEQLSLADVAQDENFDLFIKRMSRKSRRFPIPSELLKLVHKMTSPLSSANFARTIFTTTMEGQIWFVHPSWLTDNKDIKLTDSQMRFIRREFNALFTTIGIIRYKSLLEGHLQFCGIQPKLYLACRTKTFTEFCQTAVYYIRKITAANSILGNASTLFDVTTTQAN